MLLVGSGCSNLRQAMDSPKQPSLNVAAAALSAGAPELALRVADLAISKRSHDAQALVARGDALYTMGERDMAQAAYRAAVAIDPAAVGGQVGLGRTLAKSDPRSAEAAFLSALKYEPDNVIALNNLGVVCDLQGHSAEAQQAYRHALIVSPQSVDVQVNLGLSFALSGHSEEACQLLRSAAADPSAAQAWRKELISALTLAGDGRWAKQTLVAESANVDAEAAGHQVQTASTPNGPLHIAPAAHSPAPGPHTAMPTASLDPLGSTAPAEETGASIPNSLVALAPEGLRLPSLYPAPRISVLESDLPASTETDAVPMLPAIAAPAPAQTVSAATTETTRPIIEKLNATTVRSSPTADGSYVQLASLVSEADARLEWRRLEGRFSSLLAGRQPTITTAPAHEQTYWRLRIFGFANMEEARDLSKRWTAAGLRSFVGNSL